MNIKVIYISAGAGGYGGENALFELVKNLPEGYEPLVIIPEEGPFAEKLRGRNIRTLRFPYAVLQKRYLHPLRISVYKLHLIASVFRFVLLFAKLKPDVVHTNTSQVFPGAIAARLLKIPHVWHVREIPNISPFMWAIWKWFILRFSTEVVCISGAVKKQFGRSRKTVVVHDGIDLSLFPFSPVLPQDEPDLFSSIERKKKRVGTAGRINYWKGQGLFVDAARIVLQRYNDAEFLIAGDARKEYAKIKDELHRKTENYGIKRNVVFTGFLTHDKMSEFLGGLDVFVLSSVQPEPFGLVLVEAMASGKAVVAPAEGGPLDIIEDGISGILVEPRNPQAYAKAIRLLLENDGLRQEIGRKARERVEERFTTERTVSDIVRLYGRILTPANKGRKSRSRVEKKAGGWR